MKEKLINELKNQLKNMDLRTKVGQRLVIGFRGPEIPDTLRQLVRDCKIGNVILFRDNTQSPQQLRELCAELQKIIMDETGIPAMIMVDQEGGPVSRLPEGAVSVPSNMAVAASGDAENAYRMAQITSRQLKGTGMNFNLAPDLDVNNNLRNPVIGIRSWGDSPEEVCRYARRAVHGYLEAGMLCCGKHFPGHGDTAVDSHLGLPVIDRSREELEQVELKPFRAAIEEGIPAIMSAHILFPQIEPEAVPATMSRRIMTGLLREEMGFDGLILSDCMRMNAISEHYGTAKGTVAAAKAGVDMILVCHDAPYQREAAELFYEAALAGEIPAEEMDRSVERILACKEQYAFTEAQPELAGLPEDFRAAEEAARQAVCLVSGTVKTPDENTFFCGCAEYRTSLVGNRETETVSFCEVLQREFGGVCRVTSRDPDEAEIRETLTAAEKCGAVAVTTMNARRAEGQLELVKALAATGKPVTVIATRDPYDLSGLPENITAIAAMDFTEASRNAVIRALRGEPCTGKLPIRL